MARKYLPLSAPPPRLSPFRQRACGTMIAAARPAGLPLLATVLVTLAVAAALFAIYVYPSYA